MWGDITLQHPKVFEMLPEEVMFLTWDYSAYESFADFIDPVKNAGFDFMVCPGVLNSNRMMPDFNMSVINIRNFVNEGFEKGASGVLNTVWDDGGRHAFSRDWYGVAFGADQSWNPNKKPLDDFDHRFSIAIYGDQDMNYTKAIHKMNELAAFGATQEMTNTIMWKQLIPERGEDLTLNLSEWDDIEAVVKEAKSLLAAFETAYYPMEIPFLEFTMDQYLYLANARRNLIAAAKNYAMACNLQSENHTEARNHLIIALDKIIDSRKALTNLKNRLQILWLKENHMHWYDQAMEPYQDKIENYADLEKLLEKAIEDFDQGHYLPSPQNIRLAIYEQEGRYFSYWLTCGPFHIDKEYGPKPDFLKPLGGETEVIPYPGLRFTAENGREYMWDKYDSPTPAEINLKEYYEKNTDAVAYAYCRIESPVAQNVKATFGSNDGIVIYCNGEKVFQIHEKRSLIPDENEVSLPLKAGKNHLLLKIDQWKGGWGFSFRLPEENIRNHKQKYKIIE
jgi:tetratricopeptide (TPR) repeat protein